MKVIEPERSNTRNLMLLREVLFCDLLHLNSLMITGLPPVDVRAWEKANRSRQLLLMEVPY